MKNKLSNLIPFNKNSYNWSFSSVGGVMRVNIESGEDLRHLGELDQKLWTVLSCPTKGLEFCERTLTLMDQDNDGKIRVNEVVSASQWLCQILRDPQLVIEGGDGLNLSDFSDTDDGKRLMNIARQILESLGKEEEKITIADTSDSLAIFAKTRFNGDGIITPASTDDEELKDIIAKIMERMGDVDDRSGEKGINQEKLEAFYKACTEYAEWVHASNEENTPFGDDTDAACNALNAIKAKVADYFMRCKLIAFDEETAAALDVQVAKVEAISGSDLSACADEIASYPLARPTKDCTMALNGQVNPAWRDAWDSLKAQVLDKVFEGKESFTEKEWKEVVAKFDAYEAWKAAKAGVEVEELGIEAVDKIVADNRQADLQALIDQDNAVADEVNAIGEVDKLLYLKRDFFQLLRNYVTFSDFYSHRPNSEAIFQCGKLFIDQRCLELCIRVEDMVKHTEMAGLSGMYLIYCTCTSKVLNKTMNIVAVLTDGDVDNMRVGKNAIFYDRNGQDWDAVVTKIVDNPISIRQAFFSPYKKLGRFITDKVNKSAAEKEAKSMQNLTAKTDSALASTQANMNAAKQQDPQAAAPKPATPAVPQFDIAKFAGIFAAIGMALGMIGSAVMQIIDPWYNVLILLAVLAVGTSGPSVFIAWTKLRKRNLGPILNANGWAINSKVIVNILFGQTMTSLAKYPKVDLKGAKDPYMDYTPWWKKALRWVVTIVLIVAAIWVIMFSMHFGPYTKYCKLEVISNTEECSIKGGGEKLRDLKSYVIKPEFNPMEYEFKGWSDLTNKSADGTRDSIVMERRVRLTQDTTITGYFVKKPVETPAEAAPEAPAAQ